jgi:hypothetical protein
VIWFFVGAKQKNVPADKQGMWGIGDVWTWTASCADTKLVPSWLVADRSAEAARRFITDLAGRLTNRVQVTSDGLQLYVDAVEQAFGTDVDFAQLVKHYGAESKPENHRYSPAVCTGAEKIVRTGNPDMKHVSTSYVERSNLTAHVDAPVHAPDERLQQEGREPHPRDRAPLHALQLCPRASDASRDARDGGRRDGSRLGNS